MVTASDILCGVGTVRRRTYRRAEILRCALDVLHGVMDSLTPDMRVHGEPVSVLGLRALVDEYLPRGAWRLCDADDTLLYDSREGTSALDG